MLRAIRSSHPRTPRGALIFLLWLSVLTASWAQPFGVGPDGRPLGQLGKSVEARFLFPAGGSLYSRLICPLVLECQNLSREPQYMVIDWEPQKLQMPPEYRTLLLEPGAKKRLSVNLSGDVISEFSVRVNKQSVLLPAHGGGNSREIAILSAEGDKFDYLRSLKVDRNPYYNPASPQSDSVYSEEYVVPTTLSVLPPDLFPSQWGYLKDLQALVCYDLNALNLSDAQQKALEYWVRQGGNLVLISNGTANEFTGSKLEPLLPLRPETTETTGNRLVVKGPLYENAETVPPGQENFNVCRRPLDYGWVWFINTPMITPAVLGDTETTQLWRTIFDSMQPSNSNPVLRVVNYDVLNDIPEIPRTNAGWVALFILLYGVVVGPINLSFLRKKDKMLYAFVTVPIIALLFAGSAYAVNRLLRPSKPVLREIGWFCPRIGELEGPAEAELVLFSPYSRVFDLSSRADTVFVPTLHRYRSQSRDVYPYTTTPEDGVRTQISSGTWDVQRFNALSVHRVESAFDIEVDEKAKEIRIKSPIESDGEAAVIEVPSKGCTPLFFLKRGENIISFDQLNVASNAVQEFSSFSSDRYPSRPDFAARVLPLLEAPVPVESKKNAQGQVRLLLWTQDVHTPIQVDGGTIHRHDYLVTVVGKS